MQANNSKHYTGNKLNELGCASLKDVINEYYEYHKNGSKVVMNFLGNNNERVCPKLNFQNMMYDGELENPTLALYNTIKCVMNKYQPNQVHTVATETPQNYNTGNVCNDRVLFYK